MAVKKSVEEEVVTTAEAPAPKIKPEPADPWSIMVEVTVPRAPRGEDPDYLIGVNGRYWRVKRSGKPAKIPKPIYERLMIKIKAEEKERELQDKLDGSFTNISGQDLGLKL